MRRFSPVRTAAAVRGALGRRDARAVAALAGIAYLLGYLYAVGDLIVRPGIGTALVVVDDPLARVVRRVGPTMFERVALLDLVVVRWLLSPVNAAIGALLGALVGLNLALSVLAVRRPAVCDAGVGAGAGAVAAVPALLTGSACCAPVVLVALGVQASGLLLAVFGWLLPVGALALLASLAYLGSRVDRAALAGA